MPTDSSMVEVEYTGKLVDGTVFDSSKDRGQPMEFACNGVIPGWSEGLKLMKAGAHYMLFIPLNWRMVIERMKDPRRIHFDLRS